MNRIVTILLLTAYCYLAAFTTIEGEIAAGISGRVIEADFFALGLFIPAFVLVGRIRTMPSFWFYLAFMGVMLASLLLSVHPDNGMVEYLVHVFNFAVGVALFNLVANARDFSLSDAVYAFLYASGVVAVLCLLQFLVFPSWFAGRQIGGLVGTFRNTGQAGTYFGTGLALFLPALAARLISRNPFNLLVVLLIVICLILTVKRAALLGLMVGVVGMLLVSVLSGSVEDRRRNMAFFVFAILAVPLVMWAFDFATQNVVGLEYRVQRKVTNFTVEGFMTQFFGENSGGALRAFSDNPLMGVGVGNIVGTYTEIYEIHSTPLSILSSSGLVGFVVYGTFIVHWLATVWRAGSGALLENRFMRLLFPMLVGLVISWGYTYHVRKREFWVLYAIVMFGCWLIERNRSIRVSRSKRDIGLLNPQTTGFR